jgi:mannosyltransferase OCH1-like enzyme
MKLFQYWDAPEPPAYVAEWIETFRAGNPGLEHRLYDRGSAAWFIGKHIGERERRAFEACAVPAMQADYFRLCALKRYGGLYFDADMRCLAPLDALVEQAPHGFAPLLHGRLINNAMLMRQADDPFIDACLRLCTSNIEARDIPNVFTATGPGVLWAIQSLVKPELAEGLLAAMDNMLQGGWLFPRVVERARAEIPVTEALVRSFNALTLLPKAVLLRWIGRTNPPYQQTEVHWLNWRGSIYVAVKVP